MLVDRRVTIQTNGSKKKTKTIMPPARKEAEPCFVEPKGREGESLLGCEWTTRSKPIYIVYVCVYIYIYIYIFIFIVISI